MVRSVRVPPDGTRHNGLHRSDNAALMRGPGVITRRARRAGLAAALAGCLLVAHGTASGDVAAGERLAAARCFTCHSSAQTAQAVVPLLEGQPKAYIVAQWRAFREHRRAAPVMVNLANELNERDVDDIAEFYAALLPPRASQPSSGDAGRAPPNTSRCAECHGPALQGTSAGAARLAGQKARYLAWSLQLMRSGARSHGSAPKPDPLFAHLGNEEIESLAAYFASLP